MLWIVLLYALFASVFTIAKWGLQYTEPLFFVSLRMILAAFLILGFLALFRPKSLVVKRADWGKIMALGIFNIYLTNALEFWGLCYLTSFKTCFIYSLSPFASALLSYFILHEKMTQKKWIGLLVGIVGMAPILLTEGAEEAQRSHFLWFSWPELAVLGAAVATVYGWITMRQLVHNGNYSFLMANGYSMLIGGIISLIHSAAVENWTPIPVTAMSPFLIATAALLLISNLLAYNLYGYLLQKFTAPFLSFAGYMTPFFAAFFGWWFLQETIPLSFFLSGALILVGLILFYQEELRLGYRIRPVFVAQENKREEV